jgi:soluble lytic murein transglycosylase-like protein
MRLSDVLKSITGSNDYNEVEKENKLLNVVKKELGIRRPEPEDFLAVKYRSVLNEYDPDVQHLKIMIEKAKREKIDPSLVLALVAQESSFNERAVNRNRDSVDYGYFQLNDKWHKQYRSNVEKHIEAGIEHLKWCLDTANGNEQKALSRYNTGSEDNSIGKKYARMVMRKMRDISRNLKSMKGFPV